MSFLSFIARMSTAKPPKPVRTPAPRKLWQGTAVEVAAVCPVLLRADGAIVPDIAASQTVVAVGTMEIFGRTVTRSYLADGRSFVQTVAAVTGGDKLDECRLYTLQDEKIPASEADWDFLLADADGYVGYPFFDIGETTYPRSWTPGETRIPPVEAVETVTSSDGTVSVANHQLMQYGRRLGDGPNTMSEHLIMDVISGDDGASFDVFLGFDLGDTDFTIIPSAA